MAMATLSASCRSSEGESLRSRSRFRILSRASWNSLSSLACSGQLIARVEREHIRAPVENAEQEDSGKAKKRQTLFFAYCSPLANVTLSRLKPLSGVFHEQNKIVGIPGVLQIGCAL